MKRKPLPLTHRQMSELGRAMAQAVRVIVKNAREAQEQARSSDVEMTGCRVVNDPDAGLKVGDWKPL